MSMPKNSISKNLLYNLIYQIITLILPLITIPYVSRILGAEGIGIYSYTSSITQYFILLATLGISMYGNRQIAYIRNNKNDLNKTFWSILILRLITTSIAFLFYVIIFINVKEYKLIFILQSLNIISSMIDISWLFMGLEDFKKTVTRSITIKILGVLAIFTFIKTNEDLVLYVLLNALSLLLGNAILWGYLPKTVGFINIKFKDIFKHFIPSIKLFIPQLAVHMYVILDKSMLGWLSNVKEVGYYEQSEKIVKSTLAIVIALGTVMLPRISHLYANGETEKINNYLNKSLRGITYITIPIIFGLIGIANEFVPWFFGSDFMQLIILIPILSPILLFISMSSVMGTQYLLPSNRIKEYSISVIFGGIINIILNLIFMGKYGAIGACIGTLFAEFFVTLIQYLFIRKEIQITGFWKDIIHFIGASTIMLILIRLVGEKLGASAFTTSLQIILGFIVYILSLLTMKDDFNKQILTILKGKLDVIKRKS